MKRLDDIKGMSMLKECHLAICRTGSSLKTVPARHSGSQTTIVGPRAGKTTIINLLMRFYDVWDGSIYVDGSEIRDVTEGVFARHMPWYFRTHGCFQEHI